MIVTLTPTDESVKLPKDVVEKIKEDCSKYCSALQIFLSNRGIVTQVSYKLKVIKGIVQYVRYYIKFDAHRIKNYYPKRNKAVLYKYLDTISEYIKIFKRTNKSIKYPTILKFNSYTSHIRIVGNHVYAMFVININYDYCAGLKNKIKEINRK